jgi:hypothetical protein
MKVVRKKHFRKHAQIAVLKLIQRIALMSIPILFNLTDAELILVTDKKQKGHLLGVIDRN